MRAQEQENLRELLGRVFNSKEVQGMMHDMQEAEQILHDHPVPGPDERLLDGIKAELAVCLLEKRLRRTKRQLHTRIAAAAAAVFIGAGVFVWLINDGPEPTPLVTASLIPTAIWESNNIAADDDELAVFTAEIDQIENEVMSLESSDDTGNSSTMLDEMESELMIARNDFWKE